MEVDSFFVDELEAICGIKMMLSVDSNGKRLLDWAKEQKGNIEYWLQYHGVLIIRGLKINGSRQFGKLLEILFNDRLMPYQHRSTPRTELRGHIYTATEYHPDQLIVQHNEMAYTNTWPMRIGFYCLLPAISGGKTPIASSVDVYRKIPDEIKEKFIDKGVLYVRNYSELDLSWQEVFGTHDRKEVELYCNDNSINYEWADNGNLSTRQILPAVCQHPVTGESLWFNQAHLFHASRLEENLRNTMELSVGKGNLPRNSFYGDGSGISNKTIATIIEVYEQCKISFPWQTGDVLLLDNMLYSHGREPFVGDRTVLTGMAKPYTVASARR